MVALEINLSLLLLLVVVFCLILLFYLTVRQKVDFCVMP